MALVDKDGKLIVKKQEEQPVLLMPDKTMIPLSAVSVIGITTRHRVLIKLPGGIPRPAVESFRRLAAEFFAPAKVVVLQDNIEVTISEDPKEPVEEKPN